ncbi:MAG: hypothetical protein H9993_02085, partial [Candidatus Desulfovibrio faecigallinarum]|nr:hypothetical protein [Candidatus Desulfovibrio faecigallinarum]
NLGFSTSQHTVTFQQLQTVALLARTFCHSQGIQNFIYYPKMLSARQKAFRLAPPTKNIQAAFADKNYACPFFLSPSL